MNNKVVLYIAASLDGYIARSDGSVDWLFDVEGEGTDNGYGDFYQTVGTVVMGRLTYDEVLTLEEAFPYAGKPCYVLTRSPAAQEPSSHVTFTDEALEALIPKLKETSEGDVWLVGGGQLVQACLAHQLLDEVQLAVIPKVLGEGIPLFPQGTMPTTFRLTDMKRMGQIVALTYDPRG